jgi:hypothetical protein
MRMTAAESRRDQPARADERPFDWLRVDLSEVEGRAPAGAGGARLRPGSCEVSPQRA